MDVSVTIVNWNQVALLDQCLSSVFATLPPLAYEVIVVDNGSVDGSADRVRDQYPQVTLIRNAENRGFARAQNQSLAVATGRYVLMLNSDATVRSDTIPVLAAFMDRYPAVACCGCPDDRQTTLGTASSGAFRSFPTLRRTILENVWAVIRPPRHWDIRRVTAPAHRWLGDDLRHGEYIEVAWLVGALLMGRRDALSHIGGFDEAFFLFDEDIDLCRRLRAAGGQIAFTTTTSFSHRGGASSALRRDLERLRGDSRAHYFLKYDGRSAAAICHIQHRILRRGLLAWRRRVEDAFTTVRRVERREVDVNSRPDRPIRGFAVPRRES